LVVDDNSPNVMGFQLVLNELGLVHPMTIIVDEQTIDYLMWTRLFIDAPIPI